MFYIKSYLYAINVTTELIIIPNIITTMGINTGSLYLIFYQIFIKINHHNNANAKATTIFFNELALVNTSNDTNTPNLAASIVPAVVGETNLFRLSCCIINPVILMLAPAIRILANLGNLLINKTSFCSSVN